MENDASQNGAAAQPKFQVPESISALADAMQGMPGAGNILKDLGNEALKAGVIVEQKPLENTSTEERKQEVNVVDTNIENANSGGQPGGNESAAATSQNQNAAPNENEEIEQEINDPILGTVKSSVKKSEVISDIGGISELIKKEFGQEAADIPKLSKFLKGSVAEWRAQAQKASEYQEQLSKYESIFDTMPEELLNGVKSFFAGESDWKTKVVSTSKIDFNKPITEIPTRDLIEHYFPGDFEKEDFEAEEKPKALVVAEKAAKDKFSIEKKGREELSAKQIKDADARLAARKTSVASSLTSLKESFPKLDASVEKQIKSVLESGDISSLFLNKDGSVKPDAAENLMMALHGKKTIKTLVDIASKRAETAANEDILTRAADERRPGKGAASNEQKNEKVQKEIDLQLGGLNKKRTY
jgi:hypothetical protein